MDLSLNSNILTVGIIAVMTVVIYKKLCGNKSGNLPPMLPSLPIIGSVLYLPKIEKLHKFYLTKKKTYGDIFGFSMGFNRLAVVLNSRKLIHEAFVRNAKEYAGRPNLYMNQKGLNPTPSGIIHVTYTDKFRVVHQRSLSILRDFGFGKGVMGKRIQKEVDSLMEDLKKIGGEAFCPRHIIVCNVLSVITSVVFAKRFKYGDEKLNDIIDTIQELLGHLQQLISINIFHILSVLPYYKKKFSNTLKTQKKLMQFLEMEINECLEDTAEENFVKRLTSSDDLKLDMDEIRFIVSDLFIAGSETTATTLQWALILLANHRHVLTRLQTEVDEVTLNVGNISLDDRRRVPYLEATILEIMRYKTIVPLGGPHYTLADTTLAGYFVPKGTQVMPNLYAAHMNEELWIEPEVFNPDRFLDSNGDVTGKENIIPFSLGKRSCLGESLAKQELFLFLSGIIRNFDILPPEGSSKVDFEEFVGITVCPVNYKLRLIWRNRDGN